MIFLLNYFSIFELSNIQNFTEFLNFSDLFCNLSIIIYSNAETDKLQILKDNKGLSGVYKWQHKETGKIYIGSAINLSKRFLIYFSKSYLKRNRSYINSAILLHGYSAFSLSILEYIDTNHLSKEDARKLILEREQYYIDSLSPQYNINPIAGSSLGTIHTEQTKALISETKKGEKHPMFGKKHSTETITKMSGENNHFYGKNHTLEALLKMREARSHKNHPFYGETGENHPMFGKKHSIETKKKMSLIKKGVIKTEEHKAKISKSMCKKVFVYSNSVPTILSHEFVSYSEATKFFNCNIMTISKYIKNGKLFQDKWILTSSIR